MMYGANVRSSAYVPIWEGLMGYLTRIRVARPTLLLLMSCAWLFLACGQASAHLTHEFQSSFNGSDAPGGPFSYDISDAVDQSTGDVYVTDWLKGAVDKFDENGTYLGVQITGALTPQGSFGLSPFSGLAVDSSGGPSNGDVYVADTLNHVVDHFNAAGVYLCQITEAGVSSATECNGTGTSDIPVESEPLPFEPTGLAVAADGTLYVADGESPAIYEFSSAGKYVGKIVNQSLAGSKGSLGFDASGNLYVLRSFSSVVEFDANGVIVGGFDTHEPDGMGSDPSGHQIFVADKTPQPQVAEYDQAGKELDTFGAGQVGFIAFNISVDSKSKKVYVADTLENRVDIYSQVVLPDVATDPATSVTPTSATLNGHIDPDLAHGGGEITGCEFEYGVTTAYGHTVPCTPAAPYGSAMNVSADITGLEAGTVYHFRLVARNSVGTGRGADQVFGPPAIDGESATAVVNSATVHVSINPTGVDTSCRLQYVSQAEYLHGEYANAKTLPCSPEDVGAASTDQVAMVGLSGLEVAGAYHYRFIATNASGETVGPDETFTTFGIHTFIVNIADDKGQTYTQAGGHPYEFASTFTLNTSTDEFGRAGAVDANPKSIRVELPPGLIGDPEATPKCEPYNVAHADCSGSTQVGVLKIETYGAGGPTDVESPLYNLVPPAGVAAQFGGRLNGFVTAHIDASIRSGSDYGVTADSLDLSAGEGVTGATVTLWGVPADKRHDPERYCPVPETLKEQPGCASDAPERAFLTNATACGETRLASMLAVPWQEPNAVARAMTEMPTVTGCDRLDFKPSISVHPEAQAGQTPSGLAVDLHVPQIESPMGLSEADLKDAVVALPEGVDINPSSSNGLEACSESAMGYLPESSTPAHQEFTPTPAHCPNASKVGSVEIDSPLVDHPLVGDVYVGEQGANPFKSLLSLYIAVDDNRSGVIIKLAGEVIPSGSGQLTTTFSGNPQLPFEDLKLDFFGGQRAPLVTPPRCGTYTTTTSLTPWSAPESGPPATPSATFAITSSADGSACAAPGFAPSFAAGTQSNQADSFSPTSVTISRRDGEQQLSSVSTTFPPGIAGMLAGVPLCGEAQANEGACPAASKIGHVTVAAGVGSDPVVLPETGKPQDPVYLTGPYKGAPFGLAIVVPAEAGPFNLGEDGKPVVVRAKIEVDSHTAQVAIVSDPMPTILQGIPLYVKTINVVIDRENFTFNPTSCTPMQVGGTITSAEGTTASVSSRFQAAGCASLGFKPSVSAHTQGKTSKAKGASLHVTVRSGKGQANIKSVHVVLPKKLPSRLSTLNQACSEAQFNSDPAGCPAASKVGTAVAHTPVLPVALTGPAYFVSHGGAAFPDLVVVLQGDGVTVDLVGNTFISKAGITSSTFASVPDVPVTRFDLTLPQGRYSAFTANGKLCKGPLTMPTTITGQNGKQIKQNTKIAVSGCKHKTNRHRRKRHAGKRK